MKAESISSSKETVQKIDDTQNIYNQMFKHSIIPIIIHDMDMNIIEVNDSCLAQFGYTFEELQKKKVFELHPKEELDHSQEVLEEMQEKDKLGIETIFLRKDGSTFSALATPCKFIVGNKSLIHVYIQDITERKKYFKQIKTFNQKLQIKNKELEQFAYVAAHDLKSPLHTILNFSEFLTEEIELLNLKEGDTKEINSLTEKIQRNVKSMVSLITDLLMYSSIGRTDGEVEAVDLNGIIKEILDMNQFEIQKKEAQIDLGKLPTIQSKSILIKQLFQNLIENSFKFRRNEGSLIIKINSEEKNGGWQITFEDNGIGISSEARDKVFKLFQRGKKSLEIPGTGIGLSICKKIIELHGGSIEIDSSDKSKQGTKFLIFIQNIRDEEGYEL